MIKAQDPFKMYNRNRKRFWYPVRRQRSEQKDFPAQELEFLLWCPEGPLAAVPSTSWVLATSPEPLRLSVSSCVASTGPQRWPARLLSGTGQSSRPPAGPWRTFPAHPRPGPCWWTGPRLLGFCGRISVCPGRCPTSGRCPVRRRGWGGHRSEPAPLRPGPPSARRSLIRGRTSGRAGRPWPGGTESWRSRGRRKRRVAWSDCSGHVRVAKGTIDAAAGSSSDGPGE